MTDWKDRQGSDMATMPLAKLAVELKSMAKAMIDQNDFIKGMVFNVIANRFQEAVNEIEGLMSFSHAMLNDWPEYGSIDGGDVQDAAVAGKLLRPETITKIPCEEGCACAEYYGTDPEDWKDETCYRLTDLGRRVRHYGEENPQ